MLRSIGESAISAKRPEAFEPLDLYWLALVRRIDARSIQARGSSFRCSTN